jgi:hypothetical protein
MYGVSYREGFVQPVVPGVPGGYVVKATHAGGDIKIFLCALTADFKCTMPTPEGVASGSLPLGSSTSDITIGAGYDGGMEEMFLYMISLENVQAMLFSCPETGCVNWFVVDYTNPAAREWWANGTSSAFNAVGAVVSQWDGTEFPGSIQGWGIPHSDATLGGDRTLGGNYWSMAQAQAALQSSVLWNQRTAVEGGASGGLGPWKEDMRPFADEATIKGPLCGKEGDSWHEQILLASLNEGMTLNGYSTSLYLPQAELDCFVGGLVAVGIAPQMLGNGRPDQLARAKFWLDLYKTHGMATESTIDALHYPNIFLVGLRGGTASTPSYGLLVGASVGVPIPGTLGDNATVLTYQGVDASSINLTIPATTNLTAITFFAANKLKLVLRGEFWQRAITQTIVGVNGTRSTSVVPTSAGGVSLSLQLGQYARFSVTGGAIDAKSDDETNSLTKNPVTNNPLAAIKHDDDDHLPAAARLLPHENPLSGLPALSKPHYSWCRSVFPNGTGISDNRATVVSYARITQSMPICHGAGMASVAEAVAICLDGIAEGGGKGNCTLGLNFSPYINEMEQDETKRLPTTPPNVTTATEIKFLANFKVWVANVSRWAAEASASGGGHVPVGAVMLDQEVFSDGASLDPNIRRGITQKNNAYYQASKAGAPGAEVIQYNRGAWNLCPPSAPTCPLEFRNGTHGQCTKPSGGGIWCTAEGFYRSWYYTLDADEKADAMAVSLYTVPELTNTIRLFNKTAETAAAYGLNKVAPFICLGCGYMRDVMYPNGGSFLFRFGWDYDVSYDFLLGALVHEKLPWAGPKEPRRFGDWSFAKYGVFFPSIVDTQPEPCHPDRVNADSP